MTTRTDRQQPPRFAVLSSRHGAWEAMRAADRLTAADLRRGARRAELDARFRRELADELDRTGHYTIDAQEAHARYCQQPTS